MSKSSLRLMMLLRPTPPVGRSSKAMSTFGPPRFPGMDLPGNCSYLLCIRGGISCWSQSSINTRYHDSHLGKATQANPAYLRLSRSSLSRLRTLLGPQCPSQYHRSRDFCCLASRRIFLLPVRTQLSFDGLQRQSQSLLAGFGSSVHN